MEKVTVSPKYQVVIPRGVRERLDIQPGQQVQAEFFAPAIENTERLIVASSSVMEVFKWVLREHGETEALRAAAQMQQGKVVDLDTTLAIRAAKVSIQQRLPLAESIMLATAQLFGATLWTQDSDFETIAGVQYRPTGGITRPRSS